MKKLKVITLDLTNCKYLGEVHEKIRITFDFPEWYGANWMAFLDLLRTDCDADKIEVIGEETLSEELKAQMTAMHKVFEDVAKFRAKFGDDFLYEIIS